MIQLFSKFNWKDQSQDDQTNGPIRHQWVQTLYVTQSYVDIPLSIYLERDTKPTYQFCEVFQAVINALLMRILTGLGPFFWQILPAEGPQNNSQKAGSLGCCKYALLCKKFVSPSLLSTLKLTRTNETNSWLLRGFNFRSSLCLLGCQKDNRHGCREEGVYNSLNPKISPNVV